MPPSGYGVVGRAAYARAETLWACREGPRVAAAPGTAEMRAARRRVRIGTRQTFGAAFGDGEHTGPSHWSFGIRLVYTETP